MAGHGRAPKDPSRRRNAHAPARGEWVDLPPLTEPVLPKLPSRTRRDGSWSPRSKATWEAWRQDPATGMYGPSEVVMAINLLWLYEEHVRHGGSKLGTEIRLQMDGLGLTPKGRRDLRWRISSSPPAATDVDPPQKGAQVRRLRAV